MTLAHRDGSYPCRRSPPRSGDVFRRRRYRGGGPGGGACGQRQLEDALRCATAAAAVASASRERRRFRSPNCAARFCRTHRSRRKKRSPQRQSRSRCAGRPNGASRQRVGFTNGCFDILHPGHVRVLTEARAACDRLIVGLNSDASVRRLKGADRPFRRSAPPAPRCWLTGGGRPRRPV